MAILQTIRTKAAGLLIGALGLALLAFILSDLFSSGNAFFNKFKDKVFTVDGDVVSTQQYFDRVAEYEAFEKAIMGQNNSDDMAVTRVREEVYQQMVKEMMLDTEAEKLGLAITEDEIYQMTYGDMVSPILAQSGIFVNPQTRQFDKAVLAQFLSMVNTDPSVFKDSPQQLEMLMNQKLVWKVLRNLMIYNRLEEKYSSLMAASVSVNQTEAKAVFEDSKNVADIAFVVEPYSTIADSTITVDNKEIKALYDKRKENYKLDNKILKLSYFSTEIVPSNKDYAAVEKEMQDAQEKLRTSENPILDAKMYSPESNIDAYMSMASLPAEAKSFVQAASVGDISNPERNGQAFIMYKLVDKTVAADSVKLQTIPLQALGAIGDAATAKADSLMSVIKGGKDFATVANEVMPGSNGGELGWATEMMLANTGAAKEIFAAAKGEVISVKIGGQPQLIRIEDKTNPVSKVKLAVVYMPVPISDETQNGVENELNEFIANSGNMENFDKVAMEKGYNIVPNQTVSASEMSLLQVPGSRTVINWAFNEEVGAVKKFDLNNIRVVAIVKQKFDDEYMPLSEVSAELKSEIIRDKKAEKMIADLKAKNLTSLDAYAQAMGSRVDTAKFVTFQTSNIGGVGSEPVLNVYSKIGQPNQLKAPLKGREGVYAINILNKTEESQEFDAEQQKQMLGRSVYSQIRYQAIYALRQKMEVVDNRITFY